MSRQKRTKGDRSRPKSKVPGSTTDLRARSTEPKVIHVVFGPGGGRVAPTSSQQGEAGAAAAGPESNREPVTDLFTGAEVARLFGLSTSRLRTLDHSGIVSPTGRRRGRRAYTFSDLIALRTAQGLLDRKVRLRDVTRAIEGLKHSLPGITRPLAELRIVSDGRRVVVHTEAGPYEPASRQMVLDYEVKTLRDDVVRVLRPNAGQARARTAYELYVQASQLDEDTATMAEAERLYQKAIELDPWLAIAYTNLGNIRFRLHDVDAAQTLYRKALEVDAKQPEAQYNLGYLTLERGDPEQAVVLFEGAIASDPKFSDAYFNLAMAWEQLGSPRQARPYWEKYIELEPAGTWTEIARRHL